LKLEHLQNQKLTFVSETGSPKTVPIAAIPSDISHSRPEIANRIFWPPQRTQYRMNSFFRE
jgi:hypothetical protein